MLALLLLLLLLLLLPLSKPLPPPPSPTPPLLPPVRRTSPCRCRRRSRELSPSPLSPSTVRGPSSGGPRTDPSALRPLRGGLRLSSPDFQGLQESSLRTRRLPCCSPPPPLPPPMLPRPSFREGPRRRLWRYPPGAPASPPSDPTRSPLPPCGGEITVSDTTATRGPSCETADAENGHEPVLPTPPGCWCSLTSPPPLPPLPPPLPPAPAPPAPPLIPPPTSMPTPPPLPLMPMTKPP